MLFRSNIFHFTIINNQLIISKKISVTFKEGVKIVIRRSINQITGKSLDVSVKRDELSYDKIGGLLGKIGRNKYEFYESVQKSMTNEEIFSSIRVNNQLVSAKLENRGKNECWLLRMKDLLPQKEISKLFNKINI